MVRRRSTLRTFSRFSSFRQVEGRSDLGWSSRDISPPSKRQYHSYIWVLLKASSLKASCSIKIVSAADFPDRKQNFTHNLCSLLSVIIKIAALLNRHLEKSHNNNNNQPRLTPRGRLLEYCVDSRHLAAHPATTSSSRAMFKFRLFLGPPSYILHSIKLCKMGYDSPIFLNKICLIDANFPHPSRPALGSTQPSTQVVPGHSWVERHLVVAISTYPNLKLKKVYRNNSSPPLCLHGCS